MKNKRKSTKSNCNNIKGDGMKCDYCETETKEYETIYSGDNEYKICPDCYKKFKQYNGDMDYERH
jgi:hypothetical protein